MMTRILLIEDDKVDQMAFTRLVTEMDLAYDYKIATSVKKARDILDLGTFDIIITDYLLGDGTAFDILSSVSAIPIIFVTGAGDEEIAIKAMKAGAYDYLIKDQERNYLKILPLTVENTISRKKESERLRLLESTVVNANDAVIVFEATPSAPPARRILYVNRAFTQMTGYTSEEATNKSLRLLQGTKTSRTELDKILDAFETYENVRVELINYRKDGTEFWVECNMVPIANGKKTYTHWISIQRDITDRKHAEEEKETLIKEIEAINLDLTELNEELETIGAERTMSLMALTVADKIRNPATVIGGISKRILEKESVSDNLKNNLHTIIKESDKLEEIVTNFETLLKSRKSMFKNDDINKIVESVVSIIEPEAAHKGIKISLNISKEFLNINMQKQLLRVALFHVLRNAVEATPSGGTIEVVTSRENNNIVLSISDSGSGIPRDDINKIFDTYYSTKKHGFGMGLSLVKQIVVEHLGELKVESDAGKGATFKMIFPVRWIENSIT